MSARQARRLLQVVLVLMIAASARADCPESFKAGIRAIDYGDWSRVVMEMRRSIAEQPRSSGEGVRIYGMRILPYIPHYFLGLGLYRQNDCPTALAAFEEAESQGTVRGLFRARLDFFQEVCRQRLGRPQSAVARSAPSSTPRPPTVHSSPSPGVPDPSPPQAPAVVRKKALEDAVREGRDWIARGEKLRLALEGRRRANPGSFNRNPTRAEELAVAQRRLQTAAFLLEGCHREGDLAGAERSRDDAHAAWEILDGMMKGL